MSPTLNDCITFMNPLVFVLMNGTTFAEIFGSAKRIVIVVAVVQMMKIAADQCMSWQ
jgi:hypothetical protein